MIIDALGPMIMSKNSPSFINKGGGNKAQEDNAISFQRIFPVKLLAAHNAQSKPEIPEKAPIPEERTFLS